MNVPRVLLALFAFVPIAASMVDAAPGEVKILLGPGPRANRDVARVMKERLQVAGYMDTKIQQDNDATLAEMKAAIESKPEVLIIIGHALLPKNGQPQEGMKTDDGKVLNSGAWDPPMMFSEIKEVLLLGCSQLEAQSWRELFPQARIVGGKDETDSKELMRWGADYDFHPPGQDSGGGFVDVQPSGYHPSLLPIPDFIVLDMDTCCNVPSPLNPRFRMRESLAAECGNQRVNIYTLDRTNTPRFYTGLTIENGLVISYTDSIAEPYPDGTVDIHVPSHDMEIAHAWPESIVAAYDSGRVVVTRIGTPANEDSLFYAVVGVLLGVGARNVLTGVQPWAGPANGPFLSLYPNPASNSLLMRFSLPRDGLVTLGLFDVSGREVAHYLRRSHFTAGPHERRGDLTRLSSGLYFLRLRSGNLMIQRSVVLLR